MKAFWRHIDTENKRRDNLRKRCTRKPSTKFPSLPAGVADTHFSKLRKRYRSLGQHKSKLQKQEKDITSTETEMVEILLEARFVADEKIANECRQRHVRTQFPRVAATHPKI